MEYGLIGEHLPHSFSKEIHEKLEWYTYEIRELRPEEVAAFMTKHDFKGINVTIPYKKTVIPFLEEMTDRAKMIGAVNTIVNKDGKLYGDNTDFYGMEKMLERAGLDLQGKKVLILGTGGTCLTSKAVAKHMGARRVECVSRHGISDVSGITEEMQKDGSAVLSYEAAYRYRADTEVIINTTPVGMFPEADAVPIDIDRFPSLIGVADAIYNPLTTKFVQQAKAKGLIGVCGLYMLVAQAMRAAENFTGSVISDETMDRIYDSLVHEKQNIVLIGMPASGKTTIGRLLAEVTGRCLIDADEELVKEAGVPITEIFRTEGEKGFRDRETETIRKISARSGCIISTGGGAVLRDENVRLLKQNGQLIYLDRKIESLIPTDDRPTANSEEKIRALYKVRYPLYINAADVVIDNNRTLEESIRQILAAFA